MSLRTRAPRAFGFATAAYGVSLVVRPRSLAAQLGMSERADEPAVRLLTAVFAVRDTADGLACALAPKSSQRRLALLLRAIFDAGDTVACLVLLPASPQRTRIAAVAGVWSLLALAAAAQARER